MKYLLNPKVLKLLYMVLQRIGSGEDGSHMGSPGAGTHVEIKSSGKRSRSAFLTVYTTESLFKIAR